MRIAALILAALSLMPSSGVRTFVRDYLVTRHGPIEKGSRIAASTLPNGTVLAYVFGDYWCGATGGCVLLILKPNGSSYRIIGERFAVKLPIYVLDSMRHGEPDLGLIRAGSAREYRGGLWYPESIATFDGYTYGDAARSDPDLRLGEIKGHEIISWGSYNGLTLGEPL
jgi:hypothetical protein